MGHKYKMSRKNFIRGLLATSIALPVLDAMLGDNGETLALTKSEIPRSYFSVFAAMSGTNNPLDDSVNILLPPSTGKLVDLPNRLSPFSNYKIKEFTTVVSGLEIPYGTGPGQAKDSFHDSNYLAIISGLNNREVLTNQKFDSPDVLFCKHFGWDSPLNISVQASSYSGATIHGLSHAVATGAQGATVRLGSVYFDLISSGSTYKERQKQVHEIKKKGTILDTVVSAYSKIISSLGMRDRVRLEEYLSDIRSVETKLFGSPWALKNQLCGKRLSNFDSISEERYTLDYVGNILDNKYKPNQAYSNERERAKISLDLAHLSLASGLTGAVNLLVTQQHSFLNASDIVGDASSVHHLTHNLSKVNPCGEALEWHVDIFADLTSRLLNTKVGATNMLELSTGVFIMEGGVGRDYDSTKIENNQPHSGENMIMILAGNSQSLNLGQHIAVNKAHPAKLLNTVLRANGIERPSLGNIRGILPELLKS